MNGADQNIWRPTINKAMTKPGAWSATKNLKQDSGSIPILNLSWEVQAPFVRNHKLSELFCNKKNSE